MISYHKKIHAICFDTTDLEKIFETPWRTWFREEIARRGYSAEELLRAGKEKLVEIVDAAPKSKSKEEIEIFSALYLFPQFYPGSMVCFPLRSEVRPIAENFDTLEKLKASLKENDLTDFGLIRNDGYRAFQMKQYKGTTNPDDLFAFISEKLRHYGNNMGDVNLLILLQSQGPIEENFFEDLADKIATLNLKQGGHILISYNENNRFDVINTIYPILGHTRINHEFFCQNN